jgi:hypothetical protein
LLTNTTGAKAWAEKLPVVFGSRDLLYPVHVIPRWQGSSAKESIFAVAVPMSLSAVPFLELVIDSRIFREFKAKFSFYENH